MKIKRYRLEQLKLRLDESPNVIARKISHKYSKGDMQVTDIKIVRRSIDARRKNDIRQVFTVEFSTDRTLDLPEAVECSDLVALEALGSVQVVLHQLVLLVAPFHHPLEALVERPQE